VLADVRLVNKPALEMQNQMPQLNSLRAMAVAMVMWYHWVLPRYNFGVDWGRFGVTLFFVLSGFLITGILLDGRRDRIPLGQLLTRFYLRRFLRIFPLFYLVTILAAILNASDVRSAFWWHAGYLSNYYFFKCGEWNGPASHFWSLAVEEQFYLMWPLLALLLPFRLLVPAMLGAVGYSVAVRFLWQGVALNDYTTPAVLDGLAIGALLAYMKRYRLHAFQHRSILIFCLSGGALLIGTQIRPLFQSGCALISAGLIISAANGATGIWGKILDFRPLQYLGTISYGIYIFHNFAGFVLNDLAGVPKLMLPLKLPVFGLFTIGMAALSWHFFEKPLNDLKRYFPYRPIPVNSPERAVSS
jgi:peptidoglycan/LPS O-acetylase OafA/YrhL